MRRIKQFFGASAIAVTLVISSPSDAPASPPALKEQEHIQLRIDCATNEDTIDIIREEMMKRLAAIVPLEQKRSEKTLSFAENEQLFNAEMEIVGFQFLLNAHRYGQYKCDNPTEEFTPIKPLPVDPRTIG